MLTTADVRHRQIVLLASDDVSRLNISNGNIIVTAEDGTIKTKIARHQALAIFIIGQCSLTTPMIEYCTKHGISLTVLNQNLRPIFSVCDFGEANYLVRQKQYQMNENDLLWFARRIVHAKIGSHLALLGRIRNKDDDVKLSISTISTYQKEVLLSPRLDVLMGIEGNAAKLYFKTYFAQLKSIEWRGRKPRVKCDPINVVLDIGYTILFNYIECNLRIFGFDVYKGVLHQLWFKRKSLVCDLVEPFRVIIDHQVLKSFNLGEFSERHFVMSKNEYRLNKEHQRDYAVILIRAVIEHKNEIFELVQDFYKILKKHDESSPQEDKFLSFKQFDK